MPTVTSDVHIKRSGWGLLARIALLTALCFFLAGLATTMGGSFWVFLVILWPLAVAVALALLRAELSTGGDVLTYWVPLRTSSWHRRDIAGFWLEKSTWSRGMTAHIGMSTVTGQEVRFRAIDASLLSDNDVLDHWLATLHDWLKGADQPPAD